MTPEDVRARLSRLSRAATRDSIQHYFKEPVSSWGVATPDLMPVAHDIYAYLKPLSARERNAFCEELWRGRMEEGSLVCHVYKRFAKKFGGEDFRVFERWLDTYVNNWGHTDGVSCWMFAGAIANDPALVSRLRPWTRSKNRWKRRAAAVSLVPSARKGLHTGEILDIASRLLEDPDDMVQKGVGWLLKETYPKKSKEVMRFLLPWRDRTTRLVLRYAAEKMTPEDRARVLAKTG
jgi:3-methyladenine DNA glycosylase AlkD